jgi:pyruvate formate-lyase activating enzyme-like uncharacterized protein
MSTVKNTKYYSKKVGELCEGCQRCVKGEKLVLFITGICPRACYFCPVSDDKINKDVIRANERIIKNEKDFKSIVAEAEICDATGAGITGGDPLSRIDRTVKYIKALKEHFKDKQKKKFHIHLYTSFDLVSDGLLRRLYMAGLDEIRFHADLDNSSQWEKINLALKFNWKIGVEIPVIPDKEIDIKKLVEFMSGKIHFINLNELETADNSICELPKLGYETKDNLSYAIKDSAKVAKRILDYIAENNLKINAHFCTAKLKDKVQLGERLKRRAKNAALDFDTVTDEGLLVRGVIYTKGFEPGFGYNKKIKKLKTKENIAKIKRALSRIKKDFKLKDDEILFDENKLRLLTSVKVAKKLSKKIKNKCAIVTEYPTDDSLEMEIDFLN